MKHQPYKAISHRYICQIHKRSNILMTIKLSTTNSVNKTLQHKALWDLKHYIRRWRQLSWLQLEGDALDFSSEIHRTLYEFWRRASWEWRMLPSVQLCKRNKVQTHRLFISRSVQCSSDLFCELWRTNKEEIAIILGPSRNDHWCKRVKLGLEMRLRRWRIRDNIYKPRRKSNSKKNCEAVNLQVHFSWSKDLLWFEYYNWVVLFTCFFMLVSYRYYSWGEKCTRTCDRQLKLESWMHYLNKRTFCFSDCLFEWW